jgi:hypothetical protein
MTESINLFEPDMIEAVAEYMARYEKGSGRVGHEWESMDIQESWRKRAENAIDTAAQFISSQSGHWNAPRKEWFSDLHGAMAMSMYYDETKNENFQDEEQRELWRNRAHWAMIAMGEAIRLYAGRV